MPGMVNTHAHSPMTLLRSAGDGLPLARWLDEVVWPREAHMVPDDAYWGCCSAPTRCCATASPRRARCTCTTTRWPTPSSTRACERSSRRASSTCRGRECSLWHHLLDQAVSFYERYDAGRGDSPPGSARTRLRAARRGPRRRRRGRRLPRPLGPDPPGRDEGRGRGRAGALRHQRTESSSKASACSRAPCSPPTRSGSTTTTSPCWPTTTWPSPTARPAMPSWAAAWRVSRAARARRAGRIGHRRACVGRRVGALRGDAAGGTLRAPPLRPTPPP